MSTPILIVSPLNAGLAAAVGVCGAAVAAGAGVLVGAGSCVGLATGGGVGTGLSEQAASRQAMAVSMAISNPCGRIRSIERIVLIWLPPVGAFALLGTLSGQCALV